MGSDLRRGTVVTRWIISIHAPRMGSDFHDGNTGGHGSDFNPRSPHGERPVRRTVYPNPPQFQSTLPAWGATVPFLLMHLLKMISIHAPRGGGDEMDPGLVSGIYISIHAPRRGSDCYPDKYDSRDGDFNPRSPQGERHRQRDEVGRHLYFNPRSPQGERHSPPALVRT